MGPSDVVWISVLALVLGAPTAAAQLPWADLERETVLAGLGGPIDFALAPDGAIWWNEYYTGNVTRYDPATGEREVRFHAEPIPDGVERGMVGLALDPDVEANGVFYVYYTVSDPADVDGGTNRLSRIDGDQETVLLTVPAFRLHNGGRILFADDGSLFVSTGENDEGAPAQDPASNLGKILHLYPDGRAADGNVQGYVYSLGHRNVYGLAYDSATDRLFATENGNAERDEVNLIQAGRNYGWPACEGNVQFDFAQAKDTDTPCADPAFTPPIGEFYPNKTAAPTGAAVVGGVLYWASWNEGSIHRMVENPNGTWVDDVVVRFGGRINDLEAGPDGRSIYYSNWTHIVRIDLSSVLAEPAATIPAEDDGAGVGGTGGFTPAPGLAVALAMGALVVLRRRSR